MTPPETVRLLRLAGLLAWFTVGVAAVISGPGGAPAGAAVWLACYAGVGALFAWTITRIEAGGPRVFVALAAQAACVIVMTATQCRGQEGTLLVLVALQLGLTTRRPTGLLWIVLQTLGLVWGVQHHWSQRPAVLLGPPYLGFQILAFFLAELLAREARGRIELARANAELLSTRELLLETARLNERLRIARELHDGMGHHLAALSLNLEALVQDGQRPPAPLETARALARSLLDDVESIVETLHRDEGIDLTGALASLASAIPQPAVHVDAQGVVLGDSQRAHAVLRCCQEIVTNSVKHARAENLWISIRVEAGVVELCARDDGAGAVRLGQGHGLEGMRQRLAEVGGSLDVETHPGDGFRLRATLPAGRVA
jgi:signal transduction histidine kinase